MESDKFVIRGARPEDYSAIVKLISQTLGHRSEADWLKLWRWRYDQNPARTNNVPGFIVGDVGGKVIGAHGVMPARMKIGSEIIKMICLSDFAVDPEFRSKGYGKKIRIKVLGGETSPFTISTSSNRLGNKVTLSLGGKEVLPGKGKYIKLLRPGNLLKARAKKLKGISGKIVNPIFVPAVAAAMNCIYRIKKETALKTTGITVEKIERFDNRFDELWQEASLDYPVLFVRDKTYLNWRYADYPLTPVHSFTALRGDKIAAFSSFQAATDDEGLRFVAILDLFGPISELAACEILLKEILTWAYENDIDYLMAKASGKNLPALYRKFGFVLRIGPYSPYTYNNNVGYPSSLVDNFDNWYISLGDGDMCFY